jgi:hypothetical protein
LTPGRWYANIRSIACSSSFTRRPDVASYTARLLHPAASDFFVVVTTRGMAACKSIGSPRVVRHYLAKVQS